MAVADTIRRNHIEDPETGAIESNPNGIKAD
jgi:hypothetical protein